MRPDVLASLAILEVGGEYWSYPGQTLVNRAGVVGDSGGERRIMVKHWSNNGHTRQSLIK
jgi:hypothetical protein